jgi:hypothetical protein
MCLLYYCPRDQFGLGYYTLGCLIHVPGVPPHVHQVQVYDTLSYYGHSLRTCTRTLLTEPSDVAYPPLDVGVLFLGTLDY